MEKLYRINLEITTDCNLQCSFCPHTKVHGTGKSNLSVANFEKIALQAKPLCEQLTLHLLGEPLCHPQLPEILQVAEKLAMPVEITTNGLLLSQYQDALLKAKALRQINFSLQAFIDNFALSALDDFLQQLFTFVDKLRLSSPDVYINYRWWKSDGTIDANLEKIIHLLENRYQTSISRLVDVSSIKSKKIAEKIYLHFDSPFEWPGLSLPYLSDKGTCRALKTHAGIHADGTVVPCCLDAEKVMPLGNCLEEPLEDILNSPRAIAMREGFKRGELVEELCRHCSYITRFNKKK